MPRDLKTFIKTPVGLPNTCVITREPVTEGYWYSPSIQHAQGGEGYCESAYQQLLSEQAQAPEPTASAKPATVSRETSEGRASKSETGAPAAGPASSPVNSA